MIEPGTSKRYSDGLGVERAKAGVWRLAFFSVLILVMGLAITLIYQQVHRPTILIPHQVASATGPMKVEPGTGDSADYLANLAVADLELLLNWDMTNIEQRYSRFLNRSSKALRQKSEVKLFTEAKEHKKNGENQVFYPNKVRLVGSNVVEIYGLLVTFVGEKSVVRNDITYLVAYEEGWGSMFYVDAVTVKQ